jgi:hypothetical protein
MPRKKLTDLFVAKIAAPTKGRLEFFDTTFPALALRVTYTGHKSWSLFYRNHGRLRRLTIGSYPAFQPADARKAASAALHKVQAGGDPAEEKRVRRLAPKPLPTISRPSPANTSLIKLSGTRQLRLTARQPASLSKTLSLSGAVARWDRS